MIPISLVLSISKYYYILIYHALHKDMALECWISVVFHSTNFVDEIQWYLYDHNVLSIFIVYVEAWPFIWLTLHLKVTQMTDIILSRASCINAAISLLFLNNYSLLSVIAFFKKNSLSLEASLSWISL